MGGLGYSIAVKRGPTAKLTAAQFHYAVWKSMGGQIGWLSKKANDVTLSSYLPDTAYDGLRGGNGGDWESGEDELYFSFSDMAGCCSMSMYASIHWVEMAYLMAHSWLGDSDPGWTISAPTTSLATTLALGTQHPLAYIKQGMFAVRLRQAGHSLENADQKPVFGDSRSLAWADIAAGKGRDAVEFCALTGHCQCQMCEKYRARSYPVKLRYKVPAVIEGARRAWDLLEEPGGKALESAAAAAVALWDWRKPVGPPELEPLTEWLGERGVELPAYVLAGILTTRAGA